MDFSAFSHGQIQSKLWLCKHLEPHLPENSRTAILGSWYNTLGFLLLARNPEKFESITAMDIEPESILTSNKLMDAWMIGEDLKVKNVLKSVYQLTQKDLEVFHVIINTNCENMDTDWYGLTNPNHLVCLQTSNRVTDEPSWGVVNPNPDMDTFKRKYRMSQILFEGEKVFDYGHLKYSRYMLIGKI